MKENNRPSRQELTLERLATLTLSNLANFYLILNPEKNKNAFEEEYINPLWIDDETNGDSYLEQMKEAQEKDRSAKFKYGSMVISCAYCVQSMKAIKRNERELAWSYMADARYWCGVTLAITGLDNATTKVEKSTRKSTATSGGNARADNYKEIMNEAFRLARERKPPVSGWLSRQQAADRIVAEVVEFSKKMPTPLKGKNPSERIRNWLKYMPDAGELFPK